MNWKIIGLFSLAGIPLGLAEVYLLPARYEATLATPIFLFGAWQIARAMQRRHFVHGFIMGLVTSLLVVFIRASMLGTYLSNNAKEAAQFTKMAANSNVTIMYAVVLTGTFTSIISGIVAGLFAIAAGKIVRNMGGER